MSPRAEPSIDRGLLSERLRLALEAPQRPARWHRLFAAGDAGAAADRAWLCDEVRRRRPAGGVAAVLASTFLDALCAGEGELRRAAEACMKSELPMEAALALLSVMYSRGMRR